MTFDREAYLKRIGLNETILPNEEGLEQLTRAQGFAIPFENFDILLGRDIKLAPEAIFKKLVLSSRGGYCFELNGLLFCALEHFGFAARPLLARVHLRGTPTARTHQLLLATINNRQWLVDVGFGGGGLLAPMPFELTQVFTQDGLDFRLLQSEAFDFMLQRRKDDSWQDLYSFDLTHVGDVDIALGNYFTSTNPQCFFTFSRIATLPTTNGRISLTDFTLKKTVAAKEKITVLAAGNTYLSALQENFGIQLDAAYECLKPVAE